MAELTPMMRQYMDVKEQNPDSLLFFRLGDFYEMFGADARTASQELDLALTTRDKDKTKAPEDKIPMCGIPYHSADAYIARLIAKGYKVSICEQTEDPALAKGLVQREVIRTVTPGTVLDDACLDAGRSNYLCGVYLSDTAAGLCACDVSTGQAHVTVFTGEQRITGLINELGRFAPAEAVMNAAAYDNAELAAALENRFACRRERLGDGRYDLRDAEKKVRTQFGEEALSRLPRNDAAPLLALGGLLTYLYETQKTDLKQLDKLEWYRTGQFMELDLAARRNLELTETLRSKEKKGSLLWVLDKTKTPMGARNLRTWLQQPLMNVAAIDRRLNAVAALVDNTMGRQELRLAMTGMGDMERLMSRIVYGTAGARDLVSLRAALEHLPEVKRCLEPFSTGALAKLGEQLETLEDISGRIAATLVDEPPFSVRDDANSDAVAAIAEGYGGTISQHADVQAYLTLRVLRNALDGVDVDTGIGTADEAGNKLDEGVDYRYSAEERSYYALNIAVTADNYQDFTDSTKVYDKVSKQLDASKSPEKKVWLDIYNASDNFLSSTYQPLLQNYDDLLNLKVDYIGGDGQTESNITNRLGNPGEYDAFAINMVKTDNAASYTSILNK